MDLIEMYPAAVNSKVTVTLGVLNADSTIIEVLDGSVLPDAPNLLVLGSDQTAETVKLTAKEGNTLTVERAIQGTAINWPAGTQVARNFTAKDWDDLVANIAIIVAKIMGLNANDVGALPDTTKQIDIGARPNANLLHNWYFGNPVNRNGLSEYSFLTGWNGGYGIDRWKVVNGTYNVAERHFIVNNDGGRLVQYVENEISLAGKTVTLSALFENSNGKPYAVIRSNDTLIAEAKNTEATDSAILISTSVTIPTDCETLEVRVASAGNATEFTVRAVKLELGDTQTLAHQENGVWVLNEIPDYAEQMAICQQYNATTGAYIGGALPLDGSVPMSVSENAGLEIINTTNNRYGYLRMYQNGNMAIGHNPYGDTANGTVLNFKSEANDDVKSRLLLSNTVGGATNYYAIFGEHNKPSGSYTGNGSATYRIIKTGAIGNWVGINGTYGTMAVLNPKGGWYKEGTSIMPFGVDVGYAADGNIYLFSEKVQLNGNGYEYVYTWF